MKRELSLFVLLTIAFPCALLIAGLVLVVDAIASLAGRLRSRFSSLSSPTAEGRDATQASIIIVNWNGRDLLAQCLPSVLAAAAQGGGRHEIIVVDNGSTDGSAGFVRSAFPGAKLVALEHNLGFGAGNNAGVQAASNDIVVLLNNDMVVDAGFLPPLLQPFADRRVFAVSSHIVMADPTARQEESGLTRGEVRGGKLRLWHAAPPATTGAAAPCLWAGGGSSAFDRRRFLELGGFDHLYDPFYMEDVDLSFRAWQRGWTVLWAAASIVYHRRRASTSRLGSDYVEQALAKNGWLFVWRNVSGAATTAASILRLPLDGVKAVRAGQHNEARALAWAARQAPLAFTRRWAVTVRGPRCLTDDEVLQVGCSPYHYKERFVPPPLLPAGGRKRILFVCAYLPVPPAHGGAVRVLHLIKRLSQTSDVDVLSFVESEAELANGPLLAPLCRRYRLVVRRPDLARNDPLHDRSWYIETFDSAEMRQAVLDMMGEEDYHVVQFEYTQMAQYLPTTRRCLTVLDEVDVMLRSVYRQTIAGRRLPPRSAVATYLKLVRYEVESCERFDHVLVTSPVDAAFLAGYLPGRAAAIVEAPNGADTGYYTPAPTWPGGTTLIFIGHHWHFPNQGGMSFFLRRIFPLIKMQAPDAQLCIVGGGPWAEMPEVAARGDVTVTGFVEDMRPYLAAAAVSVAPIFSGAGTRIKILEAMAAGVPVVSTTMGCEGIAVKDGEHLLIADTPGDFAAATLRLLQDAALAEILRRNARRLVEQRYNWSAIAADLDAFYSRSGAGLRS